MFKFTAKVHLHNGTRIERIGEGYAVFDDETYFPSFVFMLDKENAIMLKTNGWGIFTRIGTLRSVRMSKLELTTKSAGPDGQGKIESEKDVLVRGYAAAITTYEKEITFCPTA